MYTVLKRKKKFSQKYRVNGIEIFSLDGFLMPTKKGKFVVHGQTIHRVKIINKQLAYPIVYQKVRKKYNRLISLLTELLVSDDSSGDCFREALNQIEKFRLEVKNKYRSYLKRKELEMMSKQLSTLQKQAKIEFLVLQNNLRNIYHSEKGK